MFLASLLLAAAPVLASPPEDPEPEAPNLYVPARRWALVIGASEYRHLGKLQFASRDAETFASTLIDRFGFADDTIRLMTDDAEDLDLRPTAGNMFLQLRRILADERLQATDLFVFYFAGHGVGEEAGDYLLPLDGAVETATDVGLHVANVVEELTQAGMRNVLFVVDGCRTGHENTFGRELWDLAEQSRLAIVLGCEPGQQSFEDRRLGGGVFSTHLDQALRDPKLIDEGSGALWASRVAARTREHVRQWTSRGFDGPQVPQVWTDPTRDVLLGAELPEEAEEGVSAFREAADSLDAQRYTAAAGRYAEALYDGEHYAEAAELLKVVEQLSEPPPHLLYLHSQCLLRVGRNAEANRALKRLREEHPNHLYTQVAIAHDFSGETSAPERYRASRRLWYEAEITTPDLAILVAFNMANGGPAEEARAVIGALLPQFDPATRMGAYLAYMGHVLDGKVEEAIAVLERAEGFAGTYPGDWRLRYERLELMRSQGMADRARALLDDCIERYPDEGTWYALRGFERYGDADWDGARADAARALELPLHPWTLLLAVRAAGVLAPELRAAVDRQAAQHPLSWQAGLCRALFVDESAQAQQDALDAAKHLAPELGPWTVTVADIRLDRAEEAVARGLAAPQLLANQRYELLSVLADRAEHLSEDDRGWALINELAQALSRQRQMVELIDLHCGEAIATGRLSASQLTTFGFAYLNAGRHEAFRRVHALALPGSALAGDLGLVEAAYLACVGRHQKARERLAELPPPRPYLADSAHYLRALLAARGGEGDAAKAQLARAPRPTDELSRGLAALAFDAVQDLPRSDHFLQQMIGPGAGDTFFFAKAACWKMVLDRDPDPDIRGTLAFAASRDALGNPLAAEHTFADEPGVDAFRGTVELELVAGEGALDAAGGTLLLTVRREGKVNGTVEHAGDDVWSFTGTIDRFGNLEAELKGAPTPARVFAKLAPPDRYESDPRLREHGLLFHLLDPRARASAWIARAIP